MWNLAQMSEWSKEPDSSASSFPAFARASRSSNRRGFESLSEHFFLHLWLSSYLAVHTFLQLDPGRYENEAWRKGILP